MQVRYCLIVLTFAVALAFSGCSSPESDSSLTPLDVSDNRILTEDGSQLLAIADVPSQVPVDRNSEFGAAERITEASVSPDETWLAVVTSGVAHSAAWLLETETGALKPVAFQYGGGLTIGSWSEDGQRLVLVQKGPAGGRTLTVVDRSRLGDTVEDSAIAVRSPNHDEYDPPDRIYEALGWQNGALLFRVGEERWIFDSETGDVEPNGLH